MKFAKTENQDELFQISVTHGIKDLECVERIITNRFDIIIVSAGRLTYRSVCISFESMDVERDTIEIFERFHSHWHLI